MTHEDLHGCAILKLVSGEQIMCIIHSETDKEFHIVFPMAVQQHTSYDSRTNKAVQNMTAMPWCQFVQDKYFTIGKDKVIFAEPLHDLVVPQYIEMVGSYEKEVDVSVNSDGTFDIINNSDIDISSEDDFSTVDDIKEALLEARNSIMQYEEDPEETDFDVNIVKGNDTIQ